MRARTPSADALRLAAEWLTEYETEPERSQLARVAEWLRETALERTLAEFVGAAQRETGQTARVIKATRSYRKFEEQVRAAHAALKGDR